jgi:hypothetical protein
MVDDENMQRVASMTTEEREEEVGELKARFGSGLEDLMRRRREKREGKKVEAPPGPTTSAPQKGIMAEEDGQDENTRRVAGMSDQQRETEIKELEDRFGSSTLDALRKRALQKQGSGSLHQQGSSSFPTQSPRKS